ncbi:MAG: hypothetical protein ACI9MR_004478, partial [Myxococcota bacterium]
MGFVCLSALIGSCTESADSTETPPCTPACDARLCGDDGCGASCGSCDGVDICSADGQCNAGDSSCDKSCADLGLTCGTHCGQSCGDCGVDETCTDGACVCAADCVGKTCGDDDGCGGSCTPCETDENCDSCALRLHVVERQVTDGVLRSVTIALDFQPPADTPLPGVADIRFRIDGPATLERVGTGQALIDAAKTPHADPVTGKPYRELADGAYQVLVLSTANANDIGTGRWLIFRLLMGRDGQAARLPVSISLLDREAILAPPGADQVLWSGGYSAPVVIWPEDT